MAEQPNTELIKRIELMGQNSQFSMHSMTDMIMNSIICGQITKTLSDGLTLRTIPAILMISAISEIKNGLIELVKKMYVYLKENTHKLSHAIQYIKNTMDSYKKKEIKQLEQEEKKDDQLETLKSIIITVKPTIEFMQSLLVYLDTLEEGTKYLKNSEFTTEIIDSKKTKKSETIASMNFTYSTIKITLLNDITTHYLVTRTTGLDGKSIDKTTLVQYNSVELGDNYDPNDTTEKFSIEPSKVEYLSDLLPPDLKSIMVSITETNIPNYKTKPDTHMIFGYRPYSSNIRDNPDSVIIEWINSANANCYFTSYFILLMRTKFPNLKVGPSLTELKILTNVIKESTQSKLVDLCACLKSMIVKEKRIVFFDNVLSLNDDKIKTSNFENMIMSCPGIDIKCNTCSPTHKLFEKSKYVQTLGKIGTNQKPDNDTNIKIKIEYANDVKIACEEFAKFCNMISDASLEKSKEGNKIKIYNLKIREKKTPKKIPNPDYAIYEKKKQVFMEFKTNEDEKKLSIPFEMFNVPDKEIETYDTERVLEEEYINECYRTFDTLYLREKDKMRLKRIVENFRDNKEKNAKLGIPNKLGVILHGPPGTGKSTAIQTIGSILQKPIYYLHLSTIKYNSDLKKAFDHAINKHASGGIIVFEDIDCMSEIVHDRASQESGMHDTMYDAFLKKNIIKEKSVEAINQSSDDKLTLDYLLNTLQGTLTQDETIFIMTTNYYDKLDGALKRPGRVDASIELKNCDHYMIESIFNKFIDRDLSPNVLEKIEENKYAPAHIIFRILSFMNDPHTDEEIMEPFI